MIMHQAIEANLEWCTAILEMYSPTNIQEVQKLNGRLASLSRFLPKLAEKVKLFYKLLKKTESFLWDKTCKQAFLAFKKTITTPPSSPSSLPLPLPAYPFASVRGHLQVSTFFCSSSSLVFFSSTTFSLFCWCLIFCFECFFFNFFHVWPEIFRILVFSTLKISGPPLLQDLHKARSWTQV